MQLALTKASRHMRMVVRQVAALEVHGVWHVTGGGVIVLL
jgi:phosphoribosylaminoimidazole (AIR) synthetase